MNGHIADNGSGHCHHRAGSSYLGAAFIKLRTYSFTAVPMSTLLIAMALAFVVQRTLARSGISEYNAILGTLAFVLSSLHLLLSVTFMTDIPRPLRHHPLPLRLSPRPAIPHAARRHPPAVLCGRCPRNLRHLPPDRLARCPCHHPRHPLASPFSTSRPLAGAVANLTGVLFIITCMQWSNHQPYSIPEHILPRSVLIPLISMNMAHAFLEIPFLILPVVGIFLPASWSNRRTISIAAFLFSHTSRWPSSVDSFPSCSPQWATESRCGVLSLRLTSPEANHSVECLGAPPDHDCIVGWCGGPGPIFPPPPQEIPRGNLANPSLEPISLCLWRGFRRLRTSPPSSSSHRWTQ